MIKTFAKGLVLYSLLSISICCYGQAPIITNKDLGFDLSEVQYAGLAEEFELPEYSFPFDISFNDDGTKLYAITNKYGDAQRFVREYELSIAYDVSTASFLGLGEALQITDVNGIPFRMTFRPDGTQLFVIGESDATIVTYDLSSAFDVSTAVYAGASKEYTVSEESAPTDLHFNADGSKMLVIGTNKSAIQEYNLSSNYDVSTASHAGANESFSVATQDGLPQNLVFSDDGLKFFIIGGLSETVYEYTLSSAFDVSTASFTGIKLNVYSEESKPRGLAFNPQGTKMFVTGINGKAVVEYSIPFSADFAENGTGNVADIDANDGQGGGIDNSVTYSLAGNDMGLLSIDASGIITFNTTPDYETPQDADADNTYEITVVVDNMTQTTVELMRVHATDVQSPVFTQIGEGFNISNAEYAGIHQEMTYEDAYISRPRAIFNADGSKAFVLNTNNIFEYPLSSAFDISSSDLANVRNVLNSFDEESTTSGIRFNADGTKFFVIGTSDDAVVTYNIAKAFDLTTATYAGLSEEFYIGDEQGFPSGLNFSPDGTNMYVYGKSGFRGAIGNRIVHYELSTAYDVASASHLGISEEFPVGGQETSISDIIFIKDGLVMMVIGTDDGAIIKYDLATAYDVSTAVYAGVDEEFPVTTQIPSPNSIAFNSNGTRLAVTGETRLVEYNLPSELTYIENSGTDVIDVDANDGMGGANDANVTYSLQGVDASLFSISTTGAITFNTAPDFEAPLDNNADNVFEISVVATSASDATTQKMRITVIDVDDTAPSITSGATASIEENSVVIAYTATADEVVTFSLGASKDESVFTLSNANEISFTNSPDFEKPLDSDIDNDYVIDVIATDVAGNMTTVEVTITVVDEVELPVFTYIGEGFDIKTAEYAGSEHELEVGFPVDAFSDVIFNSDGSKVYVIDVRFIQEIVEYPLTNAFDLSSTGTPFNFLTEYPTRLTRGIRFNQDGSRFFVISNLKDLVTTYHLDTPFDLATATYEGDSESFYVGNEEPFPTGLSFSPDGMNMFVFGQQIYSKNRIFHYQLTNPFEVKSAVYLGPEEDFYVGDEEGLITGMTFIENGLVMLVVGTEDDSIIKYNLMTAYDISTATYAGISEEFSVADQLEYPNGFAFNFNGTRLFIVGDSKLVTYTLPVQLKFHENNLDQEVIDVEANDGDGGANDTSVTYSLLGTDASLFSIDNTGVLNFNTFPDYELPGDGDGDNVYKVTVVITNGALATKQKVNIEVLGPDYNAPLFISGTTAFVNENSEEVAYTAITDEMVTFSLGDSKDESFFTLVNRNEISFTSAPDFESPLDSDANNAYLIDLTATDGAGNSTTIELTITVSNADEIVPSITSGSTGAVEENSTVVAYTATADESVTFSLGTSKDESLFTLANGNEINFTSSPDFESPLDTDHNNDYLIDLTATDGAGNATTIEVTITVTDVDDTAPNITSGSTGSVEENSAVIAYTATADESVTFSLGTSKDESLFTLANDHEISFINGPDFENPLDANSGNDYLIDLTATDASGNATTIEVTITVTDVDDTAPSITSGGTGLVEENSAIIAYTATADESVTFSLGTTKDESIFTLANDNEISFMSTPDFETPSDSDRDNDYLLDLTAIDNAGNSTTIEVTITVTDLDEIVPTITSGTSASVEENSMVVAYIATANESVTFSLGTSKDEPLFTLANGNEVSFMDPPDFEVPLDADKGNDYLIDLTATDASGNAMTIEVIISVTDFDDTAPSFTSGSTVTVEENSSVIAYTATANESVTFSLGTTKDEQFFTLANGNEISFTSIPDFENPLDDNQDNVYLLDLIAVDGNGNSTTLELSVIVQDVTESAPEITSSSSIEVAENNGGVVYVATANETVIFTLGTSKDEPQFVLTNGNEISFITAPDFETPLDADLNNVYVLDLTATNGGGLSSSFEVTVTVSDLDEVAPSITSGTVASFEENGTGVAYAITADESATFSLGTSQDEALFLLENENEISFATSPDFEVPGDFDSNNIYLLHIMAVDGAGNSSTIELAISVTDINEDVLSTTAPVADLKVYPNPAADFIAFEMAKVEHVTVTDLTGRVIYVPSSENVLDISNLPQGVYILHIKTLRNFYQQKFTKK